MANKGSKDTPYYFGCSHVAFQLPTITEVVISQLVSTECQIQVCLLFWKLHGMFSCCCGFKFYFQDTKSSTIYFKPSKHSFSLKVVTSGGYHEISASLRTLPGINCMCS